MNFSLNMMVEVVQLVLIFLSKFINPYKRPSLLVALSNDDELFCRFECDIMGGIKPFEYDLSMFFVDNNILITIPLHSRQDLDCWAFIKCPSVFWILILPGSPKFSVIVEFLIDVLITIKVGIRFRWSNIWLRFIIWNFRPRRRRSRFIITRRIWSRIPTWYESVCWEILNYSFWILAVQITFLSKIRVIICIMLTPRIEKFKSSSIKKHKPNEVD